MREIARRLNVPKSSVSFWIKRFREQRKFEHFKVPTRPKKTSTTAGHRLIRLRKFNRFASSSSDLLSDWNESVCAQTVRNRLHKRGQRSRRPLVCPLFPCVIGQHGLNAQWRAAISDRCKGNELSSMTSCDSDSDLNDGRVRIWRERRHRFQPDCACWSPRCTEAVQFICGAPFARLDGPMWWFFATALSNATTWTTGTRPEVPRRQRPSTYSEGSDRLQGRIQEFSMGGSRCAILIDFRKLVPT